jgi:hypothetical protein
LLDSIDSTAVAAGGAIEPSAAIVSRGIVDYIDRLIYCFPRMKTRGGSMSSSKPAAAAVERIIGWIPSWYRRLASRVVGYYDSPKDSLVTRPSLIRTACAARSLP